MCLWSLCVPCGIACMHAANFKTLSPNEKDKPWIGCLFAIFLCCFGTGYNRSKFRDDLKIKGSLLFDMVLYLFCPCCAAV
mmetsp:Transcript_20976/g.3394  ORF Transcript_20976/g.3394 Transcript_20976/m.3394 type:complete len:80 (-) Transcript_20976:69-308(-)